MSFSRLIPLLRFLREGQRVTGCINFLPPPLCNGDPSLNVVPWEVVGCRNPVSMALLGPVRVCGDALDNELVQKHEVSVRLGLASGWSPGSHINLVTLSKTCSMGVTGDPLSDGTTEDKSLCRVPHGNFLLQPLLKLVQSHQY